MEEFLSYLSRNVLTLPLDSCGLSHPVVWSLIETIVMYQILDVKQNSEETTCDSRKLKCYYKSSFPWEEIIFYGGTRQLDSVKQANVKPWLQVGFVE